jgi:hypothetical protein
MDARSLFGAPLLLPEDDEHVSEEREDQEQDRRCHGRGNREVEPLPRGGIALAGRQVRPEEDRDQRRRHDARGKPDRKEAAEVARTSASLDDHEPTGHIAERLHRAAVAVQVARAARHEALPAKPSPRAGAEREGDRAMGLTQRARRFRALVLGVVGDTGEGTKTPSCGTANVCAGAAGATATPSFRRVASSCPSFLARVRRTGCVDRSTSRTGRS